MQLSDFIIFHLFSRINPCPGTSETPLNASSAGFYLGKARSRQTKAADRTDALLHAALLGIPYRIHTVLPAASCKEAKRSPLSRSDFFAIFARIGRRDEPYRRCPDPKPLIAPNERLIYRT